MSITRYSDLIEQAREQSEPQRLMFVFTKAELPDDATPEEVAAFERGEGGALTPTICVDRLPEEVADFSTLVKESEQTGFDWDIAFIAAMGGRAGIAPSSDECEQPLKMMMHQIQSGMIANFLAMNRDGEFLQLD